jgi:hypothetical protein
MSFGSTLGTEARPTPDPAQRALRKLATAVLLAAASDATNHQLSEAQRRAAAAFLRHPSALKSFWCCCAGVEADCVPRQLEAPAIVHALRDRRGGRDGWRKGVFHMRHAE